MENCNVTIKMQKYLPVAKKCLTFDCTTETTCTSQPRMPFTQLVKPIHSDAKMIVPCNVTESMKMNINRIAKNLACHKPPPNKGSCILTPSSNSHFKFTTTYFRHERDPKRISNKSKALKRCPIKSEPNGVKQLH